MLKGEVWKCGGRSHLQRCCLLVSFSMTAGWDELVALLSPPKMTGTASCGRPSGPPSPTRWWGRTSSCALSASWSRCGRLPGCMEGAGALPWQGAAARALGQRLVCSV